MAIGGGSPRLATSERASRLTERIWPESDQPITTGSLSHLGQSRTSASDLTSGRTAAPRSS
jgi:hypothetical protein